MRGALLACALLVVPVCAAAATLRPPSVPLVAHDPYFSIWSPCDRLTDAWPVHWTGKRNALSAMALVDGKPYRLMGAEPKDVPPMGQSGLDVLPTRTIYAFAEAGVRLRLTFTTPILPGDLDVLSRPLTYVSFEAMATDGKAHSVSVYFDASIDLCGDVKDTISDAPEVAGLEVLRAGAAHPRILARKGDDLRIEWGYLYVAAPADARCEAALVPGEAARAAFAAGEILPEPAKGGSVVLQPGGLSFRMEMGKVSATPVSRFLMVAYDDLYSIRYFGSRLRPYWRRNGWEASDLLTAAAAEYPAIRERCAAFDADLMKDLTAAGGEKYARIAALAYRQCLAAHKVVADANGQPLAFSKENFSNGCIGTVDVIYPAAPQFLLTSPALNKATLVPLLDYASCPRWRWPFAPHDLGTYPIAEGQVYGGGERTEENQMPVEETGNMLILLLATARAEGNADLAARYQPLLGKWAEYLASKGFDPEMQLCTDDFAGHLAHNVNLSAKAILGLASYSKLCEMMGRTDDAAHYRKLAEEFAAKWVELAADGDHTRLAFDKPGTWSQKYNLVWDHMLGLDVFPPEVARKEMAFYRTKQNEYGLPLDSRETYTKLDWITWTASLTGSRDDFEALVNPIYDFLNETPDRVPMTDWYRTTDCHKVGFQARSVVGGVFIRMLDNPETWKKWYQRGEDAKGNWAPLPVPPKVETVLPDARTEKAAWRYTLEKPAEEWFGPDFDDKAWKQGPAGFGTKGTPGAVIGTEWSKPEIWLRREVTLPEVRMAELRLAVHHDEDAEVYINGKLAAALFGFVSDYEVVDVAPEALAAIKPGKNVIAVHCRQTGGGQYIDVGLVRVIPAK